LTKGNWKRRSRSFIGSISKSPQPPFAKGGRKLFLCDWCLAVKGCPVQKRTDYKARVAATMFDEYPHQCPDHEPRWHKGIEGCKP
jgi:hypothetical protein